MEATDGTADDGACCGISGAGMEATGGTADDGACCGISGGNPKFTATGEAAGAAAVVAVEEGIRAVGEGATPGLNDETCVGLNEGAIAGLTIRKRIMKYQINMRTNSTSQGQLEKQTH